MIDKQHIDGLLSDLIILQSLNKLDACLDVQWETVEGWVLNNRYYLAIDWMRDERIFELNDELLNAIFVITKGWKSLFDERQILYHKVKAHFIKKGSSKETIHFLDNLNNHILIDYIEVKMDILPNGPLN